MALQWAIVRGTHPDQVDRLLVLTEVTRAIVAKRIETEHIVCVTKSRIVAGGKAE